MTVYEIQSPKGKTYEIEADSMPSGAQLQALLYRMEGNSKPEQAPEQPSAVSRFASNAWEMLNPISMVKGTAAAIAHPIDTAQALVDAQSDRAVKAYDLAKEGRYSEAVGNAGAAVLPVLGPIAAGIGEQAGTGDIAGAAGKLTGLLALPSAAKGTARVARAAAPVAGDVVTGLGKVVSDPGTYTAIMSGAGTGAAIGGAAIGYPAAATAGAITAATMKASPEIFKAVKAGLMARRGISGAQAEAALLKMPAEELAATVQAIVEPPPAPVAAPAKASAEQVLQAQNAYKVQEKIRQGNPPQRAYSYEQAGLPVPPEVAAAEASRIRPIPPNKLPPVLPDPVVPEIAPAVEVITEAPKVRKPRAAKPKPEPAPAPEVTAPVAEQPPVVDLPALAKKVESEPTLDPIMMPAKNDAGVGPLNITAKLQDHPGYKELVEKVRGKSQEEALQILADAELKDWLIRPTMEMAGLEAPSAKAVRGAVERVKDRKWDEWQLTARDVGEGDVVTRPHPGQASPAFVNERLKYLQEQAAKRGDGPEVFKAKVAENKTKGAELAATLEKPEAPKVPARVIDYGDMVSTPDGRVGYMQGGGGLGSDRVKVRLTDGTLLPYGRGDLKLIAKQNVHNLPTPDADAIIAEAKALRAKMDAEFEQRMAPKPAPDKRTAMLDTAKAKLKKKKKE